MELLLAALKTDLGISTDAYDARLLARIQSAREMIGREGVTLTDSEEDQTLVLMYAAYLWRSRATNDPMPRMLRWALNNRILSAKGAAV